MDEIPHIDLFGAQFFAMGIAFEEHKKTRDLPAALRDPAKYRVSIETSAKTYEIWFIPLPPKGMLSFHNEYSACYLIDKKSLKLLKKIPKAYR